jgi:hypothetical protein
LRKPRRIEIEIGGAQASVDGILHDVLPQNYRLP